MKSSMVRATIDIENVQVCYLLPDKCQKLHRSNPIHEMIST